jgi:flagellar L-ring protein precursor FlgH
MRRWIFVTVGALGVATPMGLADSIWDRRDPRYAFLFQDNRARNIGDVVTISISQTTIANDQDSRSLSKTTSATASFQSIPWGITPGASSGGTGTGGGSSPLFTSSSNRSFTGTGQFQTNQVFTDQMGAIVVDIMPNGNLVVEGYRGQVVQGEERVLKLTGVVRPADIGYPNIVSSTSVANLRISYIGRGPQTRTSGQNYIGRIFNRLWPF